MTNANANPAKRNTSRSSQASGIVVDGHDRLVSGVELEARRIVEEKYADEWNASGWLRRRRLRREMEREISALVAEMMPEVSPEAMF